MCERGMPAVLTVNSNANISLLQGWGIVDTVTGHAHHVVSLLQHLHNHELVLWKHLSKPVCLLNQVFSAGVAVRQTFALLCLSANTMQNVSCKAQVCNKYAVQHMHLLAQPAVMLDTQPKHMYSSDLQHRHSHNCSTVGSATTIKLVVLNKVLDKLVECHLEENLSVEYVGAHTQLLGSLSANQSLVTSNHLDQQTLQATCKGLYSSAQSRKFTVDTAAASNSCVEQKRLNGATDLTASSRIHWHQQ